jgi:hypothetical protein
VNEEGREGQTVYILHLFDIIITFDVWHTVIIFLVSEFVCGYLNAARNCMNSAIFGKISTIIKEITHIL